MRFTLLQDAAVRVDGRVERPRLRAHRSRLRHRCADLIRGGARPDHQLKRQESGDDHRLDAPGKADCVRAAANIVGLLSCDAANISPLLVSVCQPAPVASAGLPG